MHRCVAALSLWLLAVSSTASAGGAEDCAKMIDHGMELTIAESDAAFESMAPELRPSEGYRHNKLAEWRIQQRPEDIAHCTRKPPSAKQLACALAAANTTELNACAKGGG